MAPALSLNSVTALVGRYPVLAGVDLTVEIGEVVLLEGANGAGKTSLLRLCAGLLSVTEGEAFVLNLDLTRERRALRGRVALCGHSTGLYEDLTAVENVTFIARASRQPPEVARPSLEHFGIDGRLAHLPVQKLSAGQRRRVALAGLVARNAEVWLLDEPHAGLDAATRDLLDETVRSAASRGVTVMMASHELNRAGDLADRRITLKGGRVDSSDAVVLDERATKDADLHAQTLKEPSHVA